MFANDVTNQGLIFKIKKQLIQLNIKKKHQTQQKKCAEDLNKHVSKEKIATRHVKRCSTSLIMQEMQVRTTVKYHLTPVRTVIMKNYR